ncbi:MAG: polymer-forming cytoskeletal protein [Hyalangium sp.]|uniref:bactofilin family protein n=1 Tax=Hyalangium sp. TaxID=2028555 RepID=UPI003899DD61
MRPMFLPAVALASLLALPAFAEDSAQPQPPATQSAPAKDTPAPKTSQSPQVRCEVHAKDGSRAVQGMNLIVNPGEKIKDAVAVDGDVLIRKGAVVEDVVAVRGKVTIEEGARVHGDAVALGGELHLQKQAQVDGDAVALGGTLRMDEGASVKGDKVSFSLFFNGNELAKSFLEKALKDSDCRLSLNDDDKDDADHDDDDDDDDHDE